MEASGLRAQGDGALAEATPAGSPRRLELPHTLSELIRFQERPLASVSDGHDLYVRLGEGVALLSYHLDLTKALVKMLLDAQDAPRLSEPLPDPDRQREELVLSLGGVASLAAQVDLMSGLMQYLVHNLVSSDVPLPADQEEITLTFNLQGGSTVGMSTVVQDSKLQELGADLLKRAGVRRVTVKITNGPVTSEAEFDPTNLTVQRGQLEVNFKLGSHSITSTTTFSKGEGLERQVFTLTAQVGSLDVVGQAFFASGLQEVKLKASLKGLTFSTLLTPEGFSQPSFGLDLRF